LLRGRLRLPLRFAHAAEDGAAVGDDGRVADVDGVQADAGAARQHVDLGSRRAEQAGKLLVLVDRPVEVRRGREAQRAPFRGDRAGADEGVACVFQHEPRDRAGLGLCRGVHRAYSGRSITWLAAFRRKFECYRARVSSSG
jgi:hypothetical protein